MRSWIGRQSCAAAHHTTSPIRSIGGRADDALVAWATGFHERVAHLESGTEFPSTSAGKLVAPPPVKASRTAQDIGMQSAANNDNTRNGFSSSLTVGDDDASLGSRDGTPNRNQMQTDLHFLLSAPPNADTRLLTSILVAGRDVQSLLSCSGGSRRIDGLRRVEGKDLSRTDLTGVALVDCEFINCDFSRSILYRASISGTTQFTQCSFRGSILKRLDVRLPQGDSPHAPRFVNCSFDYCILELAAFGVRGDSESDTSPLFESCSFFFAEVRVPLRQQRLFCNCRGVRLVHDVA